MVFYLSSFGSSLVMVIYLSSSGLALVLLLLLLLTDFTSLDGFAYFSK